MHAGESLPAANELEQVGFLRIADRQFAASKEQNGIEGGERGCIEQGDVVGCHDVELAGALREILKHRNRGIDGSVPVTGGVHDVQNPLGLRTRESGKKGQKDTTPFHAHFSILNSLGYRITIHPLVTKMPVVMKSGAKEVYRSRIEAKALTAELHDPSTGTFTGIGNLDDGNYRAYNGNYRPSTT